jgi:osmotically inducible protein OsmC
MERPGLGIGFAQVAGSIETGSDASTWTLHDPIKDRSTIMAIRFADAAWKGNLKQGEGRVRFGQGAYDGAYSFASRFEDGKGTNPEELIAAAHASCFSMALAHALSQAGHEPKEVRTTAKVHLEKAEGGFAIPRIELQTEATVPGIDAAAFQKHAEDAKKNCPVSKVLAGAEISLQARLTG